jgi:phosphoribosyl 1,2-cyclic phosphodiesterase
VKFASLGSGSEGNALLISTTSGMTQTTVMLDCGFGIRETERRLARLGVAPADLNGILVTHEHQDHVGGVFKFARRHKIPVWLSFGTYQAVQADCQDVTLHFCQDGDKVAIGDLQLSPYTVPHDAREPIQYVASNGIYKLGVLTDAGHATPHLISALGGCDALVLECNHDLGMLSNSTYPPSLRQRIGGPYGHLSNQTSYEILGALNQSRLKLVIGAHLSSENNRPELVKEVLCQGVNTEVVSVKIAYQQDGFDWVDLET